MQSPPSASQSFDGAVLARLLLGADGETSPPRIHRFSFEEDAPCVSTSFSGQFSSCYGLAYDDMDSPSPRSGRVGGVVSGRSSRVPHTLPVDRDRPALSQETPSLFLTQHQPTDDPFLKVSPTLFPNTRSFLSGQSLLSDTPSFIRLKIRAQVGGPQQSPTKTQHSPSTQAISLPTSQSNSRKARPSLDSTISTSSNRRVTVQQLALDFPLTRSRSSSLSVLVHALEDASPGWYQSLIDSALPRVESQSPLFASPEVHRQASTHPSPSPTQLHRCTTHRKYLVPISGLPPDMLATLEELESLATSIGYLPVPRSQTMAFHIMESAFFPQSQMPSLSLSSLSSLPSPTDSTRDQQAAEVPRPSAQLASPTHLPASDSCSSSGSSLPSINQPAAANIVHHPKLTKTLGLRHVSSKRLLSSMKRAVSDDIPRSPLGTSTNSSPRTSPLAKAVSPHTLKRDDPATSPKTPKTLKLQTLFRRRPSVPVQEYESSGSPVHPSGPRVARLSEPTGPHAHRAMGGSPVSKGVKHWSPAAAQGSGSPPSLQRRPPLGSFLQM